MGIKAEILDAGKPTEKLVITVDTDSVTRENAPLSKSQKTFLVATTGGFTKVRDLGISLNVSVPNPNFKKTA